MDAPAPLGAERVSARLTMPLEDASMIMATDRPDKRGRSLKAKAERQCPA